MIRQNPYVLCENKLVPFAIADRIAKDLDFSADEPKRVDTALLYVLNDYAGNKGHTFLIINRLPEDCNAFLKESGEIKGSLSKRHIDAAVARCRSNGQIVTEGERVWREKMKERNEIKSTAHSKYRCQNHIVFAPKYRRKEIYGQ